MQRGNVTVEGYARATPVADAQIDEVIDLDDGTVVSASALIGGQLYQDFIEGRGVIVERMNSDRPRFLCGICEAPVYFVATPNKRFFLRHRARDEEACSAKTRSALTAEEICARKYHGLRESQPHRTSKGLIERSLLADPNFRDIAVERTWRGSRDPARYRRPDVSADTDHGKIAFEVQLSTTFLSVVVGRRMFYRDEGALLVWVFGSFDPAYRRLTTDDLFFSNNSNMFIVDDETVAKSEECGQFHIRCFHRRPVREGRTVVDSWEEHIVPFSSLTQDRDAQRTYFFDHASADKTLRAQIDKEEAEWEANQVWIDQQDFFEFWKKHARGFKHTPDNRTVWAALRQRFIARGVVLPDYPDSDGEMRAMLNALYSAREGAPVGWGFRNLIEVGHSLAENHPRQLIAYGHAIKAFDRSKLIEDQDKKEKWRERIRRISSKMRNYDLAYMPQKDLIPLMRFLFPEVEKKVSSYLRSATASIVRG